MHDATRYVHENAEILRDAHVPSDEAGLLSEPARQVLLDSGGMRLLQSSDHGGMEASPAEFMQWVRAVGRYCPPAGWIAGVVGVHPWEIALVDPQLQQEIYGADRATWVASPYAPQGRAVAVEGGFRFSGQWHGPLQLDCAWGAGGR